MAVHFTCRLIVVRTNSGKFRVVYGPLDDAFQVFTFTGPSWVRPPEEEMTEAEIECWRSAMTKGTSFSFSFENTPADAPLVQAKRTYEDEIPKGSVKWELSWMQFGDDKTIAVELRNEWDRAIPNISLSNVWQAQTPQPMKTGREGVEVAQVGGSESMYAAVRPPAGGPFDLYPGSPAVFALDPRAMPFLKSRAASLSPEYHWIALCTDGHEFDRLPGSDVAGFLEIETAE